MRWPSTTLTTPVPGRGCRSRGNRSACTRPARALVLARITTTSDTGTVSITVTDETGHPVLTVGSLVLRPVSLDQLATTTPGDRLLGLDWKTVTTPEPTPVVEYTTWTDHGDTTHDTDADTAGGEVSVVVFDARDLGAGTGDLDESARAHAAVHRVLAVIQEFPGASAQRSGPAVSMVVTRGAVAVASETVTDLAGSAVWGLVRSARPRTRTHHPHRRRYR